MIVVLAHNWWTLALRGLFAILFGLAAFAWPGITLGALVFLFGAYALADGIFAVIEAVAGPPHGTAWWELLVEGLVGIGIGVLTFAWPGKTALVLLYLIAAWAVMTGIFEIAAAIRLRREIRGEWALALSGVLSVLLGVALVAAPGAGALAMIWLIGAYAVAFGALLLALAFNLRRRSREMREVPL